jgi:hypothetical protein
VGHLEGASKFDKLSSRFMKGAKNGALISSVITTISWLFHLGLYFYAIRIKIILKVYI